VLAILLKNSTTHCIFFFLFFFLVLAALFVGCGNNQPSVVHVIVPAPGNTKPNKADATAETSKNFDVDRFIAESKVKPKDASLVHRMLSGPDAAKYKSLINQRFRVTGKILSAEGDTVLVQIGRDDKHNIARGTFSKEDEYAIEHYFKFNDIVIFEGECKGISQGEFKPGWVVKTLAFEACLLDEGQKEKKSSDSLTKILEDGSKAQDDLKKLTDEMKEKYKLPK